MVSDQVIRQRLAALSDLGLASHRPLPGVGPFPSAESGWTALLLRGTDEGDNLWYVHDVGMELLECEDFDQRILAYRLLRERLLTDKRRADRNTKIRLALSLTVFLPILVVLGLLKMPTYFGSRYTVGQAVVGFVAFLAIPGAVVAVASQNWSLLILCVYWWTGAKVIEAEARQRGFYVA